MKRIKNEIKLWFFNELNNKLNSKNIRKFYIHYLRLCLPHSNRIKNGKDIQFDVRKRKWGFNRINTKKVYACVFI